MTRPRQRILQIEDNEPNARLVERLLSARHDVEIVNASEGRLGLALARQLVPTLVLLDLHLPDLHGEEVLRELRGDPATAGIAVIVLSADATTATRRRVLDAGADAYLPKPYDIAELMTLVDATLDSGTPS